jgi:Fe-S oxidoreductase
MADCIGSSEVDAVLVSCGTCYEMLQNYDLGKIFPNAPVMDINEFLALRKLTGPDGGTRHRVVYHEPCHTPLKTLGYSGTIGALLGAEAELVPECCGDAGTLALSRPDISCVLRRRKTRALPARGGADRLKILTTCPSCVAGLSKLRSGKPVTGQSLVVEVAERVLGKRWEETFIGALRREGVEKLPL